MKRKHTALSSPRTPSKRTPRAPPPKDPTSPSVTSTTSADETSEADVNVDVDSPSKPRSARGGAGRTVEFATPTKTPSRGLVVTGAERSARRRSAARLIEREENESGSGSEGEELAREIWGEGGSEEEEGEEEEEREEGDDVVEKDNEAPAVPPTPSKRPRGRPRKTRARTPTPPRDLPPHELYFLQTRPGASATSNNTLPSTSLLTADETFALSEAYTDPHEKQIAFLHDLHEAAFPQWDWELRNGFNIALFGYGSMRAVLEGYAAHVWEGEGGAKIVVVNAYVPGTALRDVLAALAGALFPRSAKLPLHPNALHTLLLDTLTESPPARPVYLLINSLDAPGLRRGSAQAVLASLAASPHVRVVASLDHPSAALLWDARVRALWRFVAHDATTFVGYEGVEVDARTEVAALLGRGGRGVAGRDGVGFVLKSLPGNARSLFRILVAEQVAGLDDGGEGEEGVEYRVAYHRAREELVCSTEHQFRTLLKEFYDHVMVESRRDAGGAERLVVPFRREELEGLLEDLVEG
ncbi:ORC2-domain-containing protein [Trichodelitschia bisporula]|uniref:Origin recognition complex subunit 2 n=1 Tax=Trichodelitschia bisporula TaxID=703511 RepID=A0A6G1I784_9PEZI|nr:ORC2-domain-containing protein [Trichodelitschia bisporula]